MINNRHNKTKVSWMKRGFIHCLYTMIWWEVYTFIKKLLTDTYLWWFEVSWFRIALLKKRWPNRWPRFLEILYLCGLRGIFWMVQVPPSAFFYAFPQGGLFYCLSFTLWIPKTTVIIKNNVIHYRMSHTAAKEKPYDAGGGVYEQYRKV